MAFLFKRSPKTPTELVRALNEQVVKFDNPSVDRKRIQDDITRYLAQIKVILHGDDEIDPQPDLIALLAQEVYQTDLLLALVSNLQYLEFDSRKDVVSLFSTLLRRQFANRSPTVDYLVANKRILSLLVKGPELPDICLTTNSILKDCIKVEQLCKLVLQDSDVWQFFKYSSSGNFENMTDCFQVLSDLLTTHKKVASDWLQANSAQFILAINKLISSQNYVTKRQSIKLLSQLILSRSNSALMIEYVNNPDNLKLIMILLSDKSKNVQFESFNIFKVFVANPKKTKAIQDILIKNREKLLLFLENFNPVDKHNENSTFKEEKEFVLQNITDLPRIISTSNVNSSTSSSHS